MHTATVFARWIVRVAGLIQIVLGLMFWTGRGLSLIPVHMMVGAVIVLAMWLIAVLAWRAGVSRGLALLAVAWGLMLPIFGITHPAILPGRWHWIIEVLHLAVGLGALGFANRLAERTLRRA